MDPIALTTTDVAFRPLSIRSGVAGVRGPTQGEVRTDPQGGAPSDTSDLAPFLWPRDRVELSSTGLRLAALADAVDRGGVRSDRAAAGGLDLDRLQDHLAARDEHAWSRGVDVVEISAAGYALWSGSADAA